MEAHGMEKQDILITPLIMGTDGQKMSKTKNNFISLDMSANDMFVKIMEIPDDQIIPYFESCTTVEVANIQILKQQLEGGEHPRTLKKHLSREVVGLYHSMELVTRAEEYFESTIAAGARPRDEDVVVYEYSAGEVPLVTLIREIGMVGNSTEARNAVNGGGVKVDEVVLSDVKATLTISPEKKLIQVGKKKFGYVVAKS
jgi:tyrosyl-tRNA synthetase